MSITNAAARSAALIVALYAGLDATASAAGSTASVQDVLAARGVALSAAPAKLGRTGVAAQGPAAPNDVVANPFRAYPPSCLSDGLPFRGFPQTNADPAPVQITLALPGDPAACIYGNNLGECPVSPYSYAENVTVTAWRVACSGENSAVLLEFDRSAENEGNSTRYPTFPAISITQNGSTLFPLRLADDPNTLFSITRANAPLYSSDVFVLENYFDSNQQQIDYNKAFTLTFDGAVQISFPDYNPGQYGANYQDLPISGYMSTNWYDPAHGGEGILTQIFDNADGQTRTFSAAWYTFDQAGLPFWLYTQGSIAIGAQSTGDIPVFYATNGGFAGNFGNSATFTQWGTMNVSFPDCSTMHFSFNGNANAVNGPAGIGTRDWLRIANINSLTCE